MENFIEANSKVKSISKESYISLKTFKLLGIIIAAYFIILLSVGIATPVAIVMMEKYLCNRRYINGRKLKFIGSIGQLYLRFLIWIPLTIITLGIYGIWVGQKYYKWKIENTSFADCDEDAPLSKFTGKVSEYFVLGILAYLLSLLTLGIAIPWIICLRNKWLATNTYINGVHLKYTGSGKSLAGKYYLWLLLTIITFGIYSTWFIKKILVWDASNQKIDTESRVESLGNILNDLFKNNKVLLIPFIIQIVLIVLLILFITNPGLFIDEYVVEDGVLIEYLGKDNNIVIPDEVIEIGDKAFYGNKYILTVTLPEGVTKIGDQAFANCGNLISITIPESVTIIGVEAFKYCENLDNVKLPISLNSIESGTFYGCFNLKSIYIPESVQIIKKDSFSDSPDLVIYTDAVSFTGLKGWDEDVKFRNTITWGVEYIDEDFTYAYSINSDNFITITKYIKRDENVIVPNIIDGRTVKEIGNNAFSNNKFIKNITIPDSIIKINDRAFEGCFNLESVVLPKYLTHIGDNAFYYCEKLRDISLPTEITYIGYSAFNSCRSLKNITLPDSLTHLGTSVFKYCEELESVNIPKNITIIPREVFDNCRKLSIVTLHDEITEIENNAFNNCLSLKNIVFPSFLKIIGSEAFNFCKNLEIIELPDRVESIGGSAFRNCVNLTEIYIPKSVQIIGTHVFNNTPNATIYVEAANPPSGWVVNWNMGNGKAVVWNAKMPS